MGMMRRVLCGAAAVLLMGSAAFAQITTGTSSEPSKTLRAAPFQVPP